MASSLSSFALRAFTAQNKITDIFSALPPDSVLSHSVPIDPRAQIRSEKHNPIDMLSKMMMSSNSSSLRSLAVLALAVALAASAVMVEAESRGGGEYGGGGGGGSRHNRRIR